MPEVMKLGSRSLGIRIRDAMSRPDGEFIADQYYVEAEYRVKQVANPDAVEQGDMMVAHQNNQADRR